MGRSAVALVAGTWLVVGCSGAGPVPRITPSADVFNTVRCTTMTDYAALKLGTTREQITRIDVVPQPTPKTVDGEVILTIHSGAEPVDTEVTLRDGSVHRVSMDCAGIPGVQCLDEPQLEAGSVAPGGYHDYPAGATPMPGIAPDALAMAVPLRIAGLDIPIDHDGPYEVVLGEASLPNGILSVAAFELQEDTSPSDVSILDGHVDLGIRSLDTGQFIYDIYNHGWRPGIEHVEAVLVFDVAHHDPGATLSIRNVEAR